MNTTIIKITIFVATVMLGATVVNGFVRWRDQSFVCALGRVLGGALLGVILRMVIG